MPQLSIVMGGIEEKELLNWWRAGGRGMQNDWRKFKCEKGKPSTGGIRVPRNASQPTIRGAETTTAKANEKTPEIKTLWSRSGRFGSQGSGSPGIERS